MIGSMKKPVMPTSRDAGMKTISLKWWSYDMRIKNHRIRFTNRQWLVLMLAWLIVPSLLPAEEVRQIGSRLELLVDDWLIESLTDAKQKLHHPVPREKAWEPQPGNTNTSIAFVTIFRDGDIYRMYYRGYEEVVGVKTPAHEMPDQVTRYAESTDGIHWTKPNLGIYQTTNGQPNNICLAGLGANCFTPFKDTNPDCKPEAKYKAIARIMLNEDPSPPKPDDTGYPWVHNCGLIAFQSRDGFHWSLMQKERIVKKGEFDGQNLAFWDTVRGKYVLYERIWQRDGTRIRDIARLTSDDFLHWSEPEWLDYGDAPPEHLYTSAITPYFRAPHLLIGIPMRLVNGRQKVPDNPLPDEFAVDDSVFMTSRDGIHFKRWQDAFIRPGPQRGRWWNENSHVAWGILVTKSHIAGVPDELSIYSNEDYATETCAQRRYTLRMDGFVSVHASHTGGEMLTRPLVFAGRELVLNYSTSAAGSIRVEIQDQDGKPIPGFALTDCPNIYGDSIDEAVRWKSGGDVSALAGQPVRLRFLLKDADLYSLRFRP